MAGDICVFLDASERCFTSSGLGENVAGALANGFHMSASYTGGDITPLAATLPALPENLH